MGKICDPPPFRGGQTAGVEYFVGYSIKGDGSVYNDILGRGNWNNGIDSYYQGTVGSYNAPIVIGPISSFTGVLGGFQLVSGSGTAFIPFRFGETPALLEIKIGRVDAQLDLGGDPPPKNCRCTDDSCRVDCSSAPDGFCCIDHSLTNRLLQIIQN